MLKISLIRVLKSQRVLRVFTEFGEIIGRIIEEGFWSNRISCRNNDISFSKNNFNCKQHVTINL
jgi:hypothetical protein